VSQLLLGDCLEVMRTLSDCSVDAVVTDPPYGLSFMGKKWDYDVPTAEVWAECLRVLKPGGHLLAFAGTRTQHRMAVRIEDAGFEIRDMIAWVYGSGFPKSLDVSKAMDKHGGVSVAWFGPWFREWRKSRGITQKEVAALFPSKTGGLTGCVANWELGFNMPTPEQFNTIRDTFGLPFSDVKEAEREVVGKHTTDMGGLGGQRLGQAGGDITAPATPEAQQWAGWGTALKPALEPITMARKPLSEGTVAANVLAHGTGGINVDGCRVGETVETWPASRSYAPGQKQPGHTGATQGTSAAPAGRWPANLIHDGSDEVVGLFPVTVPGGGFKQGMVQHSRTFNVAKGVKAERVRDAWQPDTGSAARFFYTAKASRDDRSDGNTHPTVKPTDLMRYLCRLVTPPGGVVLDPFMGSGSTGKAAILEGFEFIGIEREAAYHAIAERRIGRAAAAGYQPSLLP
jgi:transcriptional regulator with XRE-family HTH domain